MSDPVACKKAFTAALEGADLAIEYHRQKLSPLLERLASIPPEALSCDDDDEDEDEDEPPISSEPVPRPRPAADSHAGD